MRPPRALSEAMISEVGLSVTSSGKMSDMKRARRVKIGATLDPVIIAAVDHYVLTNPELDRSAVIDDALRLWLEREQEREIARQYEDDASIVDRDEMAAWHRIRDAAAERIIRRY